MSPVVQQQASPLLPGLPVCDTFACYVKKRFMVEVKTGATTAKSSEDQKTRRLWLGRQGLTKGKTPQRFSGNKDNPVSCGGPVQSHGLARRVSGDGQAVTLSSAL